MCSVFEHIKIIFNISYKDLFTVILYSNQYMFKVDFQCLIFLKVVIFIVENMSEFLRSKIQNT